MRDPSSETQHCSPAASIPKSGSTGMIQYLQSWFPGWGGWYGYTQDADGPEELLASPSTWNILGEITWKDVIPCWLPTELFDHTQCC